jgi:ABC-type multidrug transport system fused ATPase/permease subunit
MWVVMLERVRGDYMKLNQKLFNQIVSEPYETQTFDDKIIEIHFMNDTPFLEKYASKARFSLWSSNGNTYKLLLEKSYYEHMKSFYSLEVNKIWLQFLENVTTTNKKISFSFLFPILALYVVVAFVSTMFFEDQIALFFLVVIAIVFFSNTIQNKKIKQNIATQNEKTQVLIKESLGEKVYSQLVVSQETHYKAYFNISSEETEVTSNDTK